MWRPPMFEAGAEAAMLRSVAMTRHWVYWTYPPFALKGCDIAGCC